MMRTAVMKIRSKMTIMRARMVNLMPGLRAVILDPIRRKNQVRELYLEAEAHRLAIVHP